VQRHESLDILGLERPQEEPIRLDPHRDMIAGVDAHDLYGLPLDRFVPERTALARELRKAGKRDEAEVVGALRKPSVAAWAVNQLVRTQGRPIAALFAAGDAVQRAQADLLAGEGDSSALRQALNDERQAVADLVAVARGLLSSDGHELSPATLERVSETLDAAALEDEARAQTQEGCLNHELRRVGLGGGLAPPIKSRPATKTKQGKPRARAGDRGRSATTPKAGARRQAPDLSALRKTAADARRAAERAARDLESARAKRDRVAAALEAAEAAVAEASEHARVAEAEHSEAERKLRSAT